MSEIKKIKLKVCGMRSSENILEVAKLLPDYMGFIFYKGSRRYVGDDFFIPDEFPETIGKVGVFVDDLTGEIIRLARKHQLGFIQLHGNESVAQCRELKEGGFKLIKAFSIDKNFDFKIISEFKNLVDFCLFDTKGVEYGGNGITFDWRTLEKYDQEIPFFLSGGISLDNVGDLSELRGMNIHAIDVNSRMESAVAIKDAKLIYSLGNKMKVVNQ